MDGVPLCEMRRAIGEVPVASSLPVHAEAQPVLAVAVLADANSASRISNLAPATSSARRVRRLRVGKDGLFPW